VREPFSGRLLIGLGEPARGDVIVFRYPDDPRIDYIKRVVGVPGDLIEIREGRLWVNGQIVDRVSEGEFRYFDHLHDKDVVKRRYREIATNGAEYTVIRNLRTTNVMQSPRWRVPPDRYFMMGDNRDHSKDGRVWGTIRLAEMKGPAFIIYWSWNFKGGWLEVLNPITWFTVEKRWSRLGNPVH